MKAKKTLILTCVAGILLSSLLYFYSPQEVATHFNSKGVPNGWMSKNTCFLFWIITYLLMTALYLGIDGIIKKMPEKFRGLPEKKEEQTQIISRYVLTLGATCNVFFITLEVIVFKANMHLRPSLNMTVANTVIGIFTGYVIIWLILFLRKIRQFKRGENQ